MTAAESARLTLLVLYSDRMEECRAFYSALGLCFAREQHGQGPQHYAAVLDDGSVFEIYPASPERRTGITRLGFRVDKTLLQTPLEAGHHILTDPDGRKVDLHVV
ncbi:hypothetical protein JCM3263A_19720 [Thermobifida fusca]|jgi:catechol 2,3-dioxygenase-like lactoylglutathione lyase family enzyme|uniref:Glyoxalase/bleomycin resistance/dioxygenase family protein n=2 Tax=Thermobifida fusca TaxID=2021 RepID=A0A9P2WR35_THEFU|nr:MULTISPECIES: glyoxalase/bleomycin resistance/dioxygenase family protein [Thermobifida]AAZ55587.1 hypothetical protein Tfu_1551 [Thermobifida fusca YX]EOR71431.1 hypothetical protein TM51_08091 [Thermobifida fusca TM51]MBO2528429.1 glyoxalase/bleomycin resistance/dioxygenase family protein [Thermobifida sp.]MDD6792169.1 glyoxalase/bleomycin resistance/dioxygenase family protein [Thermobifida fusca]PPS90189.1 hypothetical protein BH05_15310 [Thermobifida fusca]